MKLFIAIILSEDMTVPRVSLMKSEIRDGKRIYKEIYAEEV